MGYASVPMRAIQRADEGRTGELETCHKCDGDGDDGVGLCVECNGTGQRRYGPRER